jgi:hypothetical protein
VTTSIKNKPEGVKPNRLDGAGYSLQEAKTGLNAGGENMSGRIIIGKNYKGDIIMKDGTHLLEGYRQQDIPIPKSKIKLEDGVKIEAISSPQVTKTPKAATPPAVTATEGRVYERMKAENPDVFTDETSREAVTLKEEARKAIAVVEKDKQEAFDIAVGARTSNEALSSATNIALTEKAIQEGNTELANRLVRSRSINLKRMGREISAERLAIGDDSYTRYLNDLIDTRLNKLGNKFTEKITGKAKGMSQTERSLAVIDDGVDKAMKQIASKKLTVNDALDLLEKMRCI